MEEFKGDSEELLTMKLTAIESLVRSYTNNKFQNRHVRLEVPSVNGELIGFSPYLSVGDTVEISQSLVNDGLYVITGLADGKISISGDREIYDNPLNMVTKIIYPPDVRKGVIDLMIWEKNNRQKVGVKAETLSRHSVTYYDQDANNQVMGYPVSLLGFLKPYMKARF